MSALLRGLNRAFPYSGMGSAALEEQLGTLFKLCHLVSFNIATQALQLVYQVLCSRKEGQISDRCVCLMIMMLIIYGLLKLQYIHT
ncbi:CCAAT/enhancer-binding protein zeta [Portunus trituberculatus]|uniref:CCAAT/enhancer-binding protein zeta n=1 Tax=Portunus trituberculatus TaxID=210409 RepID=A0A5B7I0W2_PORTR|nr:CCAAT/enhancer-binding protein zeta [Portunus trituberculatus]